MRLFCAICGEELTVHVDQYGEFEVENCPECITAAFDGGFELGVEESALMEEKIVDLDAFRRNEGR